MEFYTWFHFFHFKVVLYALLAKILRSLWPHSPPWRFLWTRLSFFALSLTRHWPGRQQIRSLRTRCNSALNVLHMLSGTSWSADRVTLLWLHRALVRSVLDYDSVVYDCASAINLCTLDTVHHAGIRLVTGAFHTSHIDCLLVDAWEPSLSMHRDILLCSYSAKISGFPTTQRIGLFCTPVCLPMLIGHPFLDLQEFV